MDHDPSPIVGIDLGTTNSVVAALINGRVQVIREDGLAVLPSVVALAPDDTLLVGQAARNQQAVYPDRTIASVKRRMGEVTSLSMAGQQFTPQEVSAIILRRLRHRASQALGAEVTRAVITVPAFFNEHQRQATREAGQLAGFTVERIINEPTAASLVYHAGEGRRRHLIVYDLGGGTFDVSIVRLESGVVEVLSSVGDTHLGGDDFDQLLAKHVAGAFLTQHGIDLMEDPATRWRLAHACERAKCELSTSSTVRVAEEFIATVDGQSVNLDVEVSRHEYEELIGPLVERTISKVDQAIRDSGLSVGQLDELVLVGGSSRTPLVQQRLRQEFNRDPHWAVDPDLAVALGAATQAAMQQGVPVGPVLIDVATHTLGVEALAGSPFSPELVFCPIIRRNSPLPARYEEDFRTVVPGQECVDVHVFQGESRQLSQNRSIGRFLFDGLNEARDARGTVLICFELTLDGTLSVTAKEQETGLSKSLKIDNALANACQDTRQAAQQRLHDMFDRLDDVGQITLPATGVTVSDVPDAADQPAYRVDPHSQPQSKLHQLVHQAASLRHALGREDQQDVDRLTAAISQAQQEGNQELLPLLESELDDLLFYLTE